MPFPKAQGFKLPEGFEAPEADEGLGKADVAAAIIRGGSGLLGAGGSLPGAAAGGLGEILAQLVESAGGHAKPQTWAQRGSRVATEAGLGLIPAAKISKPFSVLGNFLRSGALAAGGDAARQLSEKGTFDVREIDKGRAATVGAIGGGVGAAFQKGIDKLFPDVGKAAAEAAAKAAKGGEVASKVQKARPPVRAVEGRAVSSQKLPPKQGELSDFFNQLKSEAPGRFKDPAAPPSTYAAPKQPNSVGVSVKPDSFIQEFQKLLEGNLNKIPSNRAGAEDLGAAVAARSKEAEGIRRAAATTEKADRSVYEKELTADLNRVLDSATGVAQKGVRESLDEGIASAAEQAAGQRATNAAARKSFDNEVLTEAEAMIQRMDADEAQAAIEATKAGLEEGPRSVVETVTRKAPGGQRQTSSKRWTEVQPDGEEGGKAVGGRGGGKKAGPRGVPAPAGLPGDTAVTPDLLEQFLAKGFSKQAAEKLAAEGKNPSSFPTRPRREPPAPPVEQTPKVRPFPTAPKAAAPPVAEPPPVAKAPAAPQIAPPVTDAEAAGDPIEALQKFLGAGYPVESLDLFYKTLKDKERGGHAFPKGFADMLGKALGKGKSKAGLNPRAPIPNAAGKAPEVPPVVPAAPAARPPVNPAMKALEEANLESDLKVNSPEYFQQAADEASKAGRLWGPAADIETARVLSEDLDALAGKAAAGTPPSGVPPVAASLPPTPVDPVPTSAIKALQDSYKAPPPTGTARFSDLSDDGLKNMIEMGESGMNPSITAADLQDAKAVLLSRMLPPEAPSVTNVTKAKGGKLPPDTPPDAPAPAPKGKKKGPKGGSGGGGAAAANPAIQALRNTVDLSGVKSGKDVRQRLMDTITRATGGDDKFKTVGVDIPGATSYNIVDNPESVETLLKKIGRTGTGLWEDIAKQNKGFAVPELSAAIAGALTGGMGGAALGASQGYDPVMSGLVGAAGMGAAPFLATKAANLKLPDIGAMASSLGDTLGNPRDLSDLVASTAEKIPQIQRANLLMSAEGLPANALAGPYGSQVMAGLELALKGDARGLEILKASNPIEWGKRYLGNWKEGARHVAEGELGRAEGLDGATGPIDTVAKAYLSTPAVAMTTGDVTTRSTLEAAGLPEKMARDYTLTGEPEMGLTRWLANAGRGTPKNDLDRVVKAAGNTMLPFKRTPANIVEQGITRLPFGVGMVANALKNNGNIDFRDAAVESGLGTVATLGGYAAGSNLDPETARTMKRYATNLGGVYSLPVSLGYTAGQAAQRGQSSAQSNAQIARDIMPLPTDQPIRDLLNFLQTGAIPRGALPATAFEAVQEANKPIRQTLPSMPGIEEALRRRRGQ